LNNLISQLGLEKYGFWFAGQKFEVISNVRITKRVCKNKGYNNPYLNINKTLLNKLDTIYVYNIDPYKGLSNDEETKPQGSNKYQTEESKK
jgi:hypothetical protein